jgi:hypothetical protein
LKKAENNDEEELLKRALHESIIEYNKYKAIKDNDDKLIEEVKLASLTEYKSEAKVRSCNALCTKKCSNYSHEYRHH